MNSKFALVLIASLILVGFSGCLSVNENTHHIDCQSNITANITRCEVHDHNDHLLTYILLWGILTHDNSRWYYDRSETIYRDRYTDISRSDNPVIINDNEEIIGTVGSDNEVMWDNSWDSYDDNSWDNTWDDNSWDNSWDNSYDDNSWDNTWDDSAWDNSYDDNSWDNSWDSYDSYDSWDDSSWDNSWDSYDSYDSWDNSWD